MKRVLVTVLLLIASASAQNWTAVTATKLSYVDKSPIVTGKLCVTATNDANLAISFKTGDGEQVAAYTKCVAVTNGVAAALSLPNPATTTPQNIKYKFEVKDNSGVVLTYKGVYFTGTTFSFDDYVPNTTALKTGQSVDVLTVKDLTITTSCVGCGEGGAGAAGVASFNGRTGVVTPQSNDYSWSQIASKPATFTPSTHNHTKSEVTDFPTTWAWGSLTGVPSTFTPSAHNQAFTTITGVLDLAQMPNCTVDGQVAKRVSGAWQCAADATGAGGASGVSSFNGSTGDITYAPAWNDVTSKPTEFTPAAHDQAISTITGLQTSLDGKLDTESTPGTCTVAATGKVKLCVGSASNRLMFSYSGSAYSAAMQASDVAVVAVTGDYADLLNKPTLGTAAAAATTDFAAASHTQAISTITDLQTALDGKQASGSYATTTQVNAKLDGAGCTNDGSGNLTCNSFASNGTGYSAFSAQADSTTAGDYWWSTTDNFKWRGRNTATTYTAATTADLTNYVSTSALDSTLITSKFTGTGDYLKSDGTKGTPAGGVTIPSTTALLKGDNAGGVVAATAGTDYALPGVANVTTTVDTTAIAANTCTAATTVTMTGLTTSMTLNFTPTSDTSSVTGWGSTGGLVIVAWPTANTLNYKRCNQTGASITPGGSVTFNVSAR